MPTTRDLCRRVRRVRVAAFVDAGTRAMIVAVVALAASFVELGCDRPHAGPPQRIADLVYPSSSTLPGSTSHQRRVTFANDRRVVLPRASGVSPEGWRVHADVRVEVPPDARLELAWGAAGQSVAAPRLRVRALGPEPDGESRVLLERELTPPQDGVWVEDVVEPLPAGPLRLVFESEADDERRIEIAAPLLVQRGGRLATPNIILVSLDTLRAEDLSVYGSKLPTSPNMERLFGREGAVVEQVVSPATETVHGHMAMLNGVQPCAARRFDGDWSKLLPGVRSLAEMLAAAGYRTASFNENGMIRVASGFDRGFDTYIQDSRPEESMESGHMARGHIEDTFAKGIAWIDRHREESFFLFLHTYQVHNPYDPPPRHVRAFPVAADASEAERDLAAYRAEIAYADEQIGRVFAALEKAGLDERTIVVVTSDHGDEFGEHGRRYHGGNLVSEVLHVPLLLRGPGVPVGKRHAPMVGLQDLAPTLLEMLGLPVPAEMDGISFASGLAGTGTAPLREVFSQAEVPFCVTYQGVDQTWLPPSSSITRWPLRLVRSRRPDGIMHEAFDLVADPGETKDLYRADPARFADLLARLDALPASCAERAAARQNNGVGGAAAPPAAPEVDDAQRLEKLRTLGYLQ